MPLDGTVVSGLVSEIIEAAVGGRIDKIYQPEADEIIINLRSKGSNLKLLLSANPAAPKIHFTKNALENPIKAPMFCMVLRKHLTGGKLIGVTQPSFERIVVLHIEAMSELGDLQEKKCIIEIMGKHSNIILTDHTDTILGCVKQIPHDVSSLRVVLPGFKYTFPPGTKADPTVTDEGAFYERIAQSGVNVSARNVQEAIYKSYNGISPIVATDICTNANIPADSVPSSLSTDALANLYAAFARMFVSIRAQAYRCCIYSDKSTGVPVDFSCVMLGVYDHLNACAQNSPSEMLETFYREKDTARRISTKTAALRKTIQSGIARCAKKAQTHKQTLEDIANMDHDRLCGELITANIYKMNTGMTTLEAEDYYNGGTIMIELDSKLTPSENAQRYYKRYNKAKRTQAALAIQMKNNEEELGYLESVLASLELVTNEAEISEIRAELDESGTAVNKNAPKRGSKQNAKASNKPKRLSDPMKFTSAEGFTILVGKNNKQNDELTLSTAAASDIWLHTKDIPGSHVIIRAEGREVPEATIMEAAKLAAFYSKAKNSSNVPVDFTLKKHVKKPGGAKPGMVIYTHNRTLYVTPSENEVNAQ